MVLSVCIIITVHASTIRLRLSLGNNNVGILYSQFHNYPPVYEKHVKKFDKCNNDEKIFYDMMFVNLVFVLKNIILYLYILWGLKLVLYHF